MHLSLSKLGLGLLASVSVTALVAGSAQAHTSLLEVHGYMDHGKLVAVKVIEHDFIKNPKKSKPPTYTYDSSYPYAATVTAAKTPTLVVAWGLYDTVTCMGSTAGKTKLPAKSLIGKWSTSITTSSTVTTASCPSGITNFSTSNVFFDVVSPKVKSGAVATGTSVWTASVASTSCPMSTTPSCVYKFVVTDPDTVTYTP
jgi:hypothetical protein